MNTSKKYYFSAVLALMTIVLSGQAVLAVEKTPATVSSNQLCADGSYTCTIPAKTAAEKAALTIFSRDLSLGSQGSEVLKLQQFLNQQGLFFGPFLGYFGPVTQKALIAFQVRNAITPSMGYFGAKTRAVANVLNNAALPY